MNYTNPNEIDKDDDPLDWLSSSLIFAKTLGKIFKKSEGMIIDLVGDMTVGSFVDVKKVVVYEDDDMIKIKEFEDEDVPEGTWVWMHKHEELN